MVFIQSWRNEVLGENPHFNKVLRDIWGGRLFLVEFLSRLKDDALSESKQEELSLSRKPVP